MLFNSYIFLLLFLPLCIIGYFTCNHFRKYSLGQAFLLIMSLWFYAFYNIKYFFIILASILINYGFYLLIQKFQEKKSAKYLMISGVLINLVILIYFKYMDFMIENINIICRTNLPLLKIALPLGISFFTFQQISFIVDTYKGEVPSYKFLHYASFVTYFPQLVAGPIVTHDELVPQFLDKAKKHLNYENLAQGLYIFAIGLAKKILLADVFGQVVNYGYASLENLSSFSALVVMLAYTFQIYFDFSGYCDMAIGIGKMMNIDLPLNFNSPYKALTITEFWDRWHITLTRFFTKYVYIPLGGNRKGAVRTYRNILIVFLLSGLWHGASWTFVFWGFCHGLFMLITRFFHKFSQKIPSVLNWLLTFTFINVAWVFFRADNFSQATMLLKKILFWEPAAVDTMLLNNLKTLEWERILTHLPIEGAFPYFLIIIYFTFAFLLILGCKNSYEKMQKFKPSIMNLFTTLMLILWSIMSLTGISTFLYFNF